MARQVTGSWRPKRRTRRLAVACLLVGLAWLSPLSPASASSPRLPAEAESALALALGIGSEGAELEIVWDQALDEAALTNLRALRYEPAARRVTAAIDGRPVSGSVRLIAAVPTPLRRIAAGDPLAAADLGLLDVDLLAMHRDTVREADAVIDRSARRPLEAGRPILARDLRLAAAVRRNEFLTLRVERGAARIETEGKALQAAALGESVRVQSLATKKVVTGRLVAPGLVIVDGGRP